MNLLGKFLLSAALCLSISEAYKILVVFPLPGPSHGILGDGVVRHLLNAGHEVTYVTPFPKDSKNPKLKQIDVSVDDAAMPKMNLKDILNKEQSAFDPNKFFDFTIGTHQRAIQNENMQKILNDPQQTFDVVVAEWMVCELYTGLAAFYGCPFIWVSTVEPHSTILSLIDDSLNPAYNPGLFSTTIPPYNFVERAKELLLSVANVVLKDVVLVRYYEQAAYDELYVPLLKKKGRPVLTYEEVRYNVSLVLGNSHVSLGQATRLPQNYKPIGGYHIDTNFKPLPEDLKNLLDNAKNGVIYFSMGSNIKSKDMPEELKRSLLKMFSGLKQTVLWKFEEVLTDLPKNVHIVKWAPQPAILSHPNCILFITHGGLLSYTEAVHFGKPTVGIPVFADQFLNVERIGKKGLGKRVDLSYTMADDLKIAINDVLSNPSYMTKAKELSLIYHDRPTPPGGELVHWVEHVIKTGGAPHLRSPALNVPFYQKMYLDLAALVVVVIIALRLIVKRLCNSCRKKKVSSEKKNK
ncbi:UDP-glucuronosyltransferase 2B15-like [Ostrinia furnacalis]|uniref:UDP-glucuronosyltransferase n=1 Tax=Ostrinia furnacalis TaxID=93504 RepID=A0A7H1CRH0_OSTFU|nr:UDP-glucuronosyltransferase 2B15-like [Ostrinia furnacalis]XP_028166365.1 UDP-glucuronosyltransferase 2B15-like [Ostrinia furnacalis]QNS26328.1 UDP-glycosyltransferase UGT40AN6 [Ostrinia furnacalis]